MASSQEGEVQEMSQVVDDDYESADEDDDVPQVEEVAEKKKLFELDEICSYRTFRVVRIKDRNLGILYWSIVTIVMLYIIIFAIGIEGKHQFQEAGIGTVITRFKGKAFVENKVYDETDLRFPEVEPFGAFIMTKSISVKGQTVNTCVNYGSPCPCRPGAVCIDDKFCQEESWCPSLDYGNTRTPPAGAVVERIVGLENAVLQIMSGIAFPGIGNYFFVTGKSDGAQNPFKSIKLKTLLTHVQPPMKLEDIADTGALIGVSFFWSCDVDIDCEPSVVVRRLDNGKGFTQKRSSHSTDDMGVATREAVYMYGLRILVDSAGIGRKVSLSLIILQIGSGLALLRVASMASDFLMLKLYNPVVVKAYTTCKIIETKDYSDLQDRINKIKELDDEQQPFLFPGDDAPDTAAQRTNVQGGTATLGLGRGSRGGVAGKILKGR